MVRKNPEERRRGFKSTVSAKDARLCRKEISVKIRKAKKDERLVKRRQGNRDGASEQVGKEEILIGRLFESKNNANSMPSSEIQCVLHQIKSSNDPAKHPAVANPNSVTLFAEFLTHEDGSLRLEAASLLTEIASVNARLVADSGAIPSLVGCLLDMSESTVCLREQAIMCLGNIAGESGPSRDNLLKNEDLVHGMILNLTGPKTPTILAATEWAVSNLCRNKDVPDPDRNMVNRFIAPLAHIVNHCEHSDIAECYVDVLTDALWALSYLSDGSDDDIEAVLNSGVLCGLKLVLENKRESRETMIPFVRIMGNLVTGSETQTDKALDIGILKHASFFLSHPSNEIKKDACWMLSNIAMGSRKQLDSLFSKPVRGAIRKVIDLATNGAWGQTKREALWALANMISKGVSYHHQFLVGACVFEPLCIYLQRPCDDDLLLQVLKGIAHMFNINEEQHQLYRDMLLEDGGAEAIESLQYYNNDDVYAKANFIISQFFAGEDDEMDQNIAPSMSQDGTIEFGLHPKALFRHDLCHSSPRVLEESNNRSNCS